MFSTYLLLFLVVAFPAAPTPGSTSAYRAATSYLPGESYLTPDLVPETGAENPPVPVGTDSLALDSGAATEKEAVTQVAEQPDELQQQLPRQLHIQQHLKLHFHPQDKTWRGTGK